MLMLMLMLMFCLSGVEVAIELSTLLDVVVGTSVRVKVWLPVVGLSLDCLCIAH